MAVLQDARGNEFSGALDHISGQTLTDARTASAALVALNAESVIDLNGHASLTATVIAGAATVPTLAFEGSVDGTNFFTLPCPFATGVILQTASTTAHYSFPCQGLRRVRCRVSTAGTNAATVFMRASQAYVEPSVLGISATAVGAATTLTFTTPGAGNFIWLKSVRLMVAAAAAQASAVVTNTNWPAGTIPTSPAMPAGATIEVYEKDFAGKGVRCTAANTATSFAVTPAATNTAILSAQYYVSGFSA